MADFRAFMDRANSRIKAADHMLTQTYPLVMDPKLLLAVVDNLFLSIVSGMTGMLCYEREFRRVPAFVENFENKFRIFSERCVPRYKISKEYLIMIQEVKDLIIAHKDSPVEFARKDSFVMCSDSYRIKTVYLERIRKYVELTKKFLSEISVIIGRDERVVV